MADDAIVKLRLILEQAAQAKVERGIQDVANYLGELDEQDFDNLVNSLEKIAKETEAVNARFKQANEEAAALRKKAQAFQSVGIGLSAVGGAIVGAYVLNSKKYISFIESAGIKNDEVATRWIAASKKIDNAWLNVGRSTSTVLLPLLERAATLMEKMAMAVERNPDAVKAILNVGIAASVMGAVALAAAKGIRIYADLKFLAAQVAHTRSMDRLSAAMLGQNVGAAGGSVIGGATKTLGTVALYAAVVYFGAQAGAAIGNALGKIAYGESWKKQDLGDAGLTAARLPVVGLGALAIILERMGGKAGKAGDALGDQITKYDAWLRSLGLGKKGVEEMETALRDFEAEAKQAAEETRQMGMALSRVEVLINLEKNLAALDSELEKSIADVRADATDRIADAKVRLNRTLQDISSDLNKNLANLAKNFAKSNQSAEASYQKQRAETVQAGEEQIQKIREDAAEKLRRLEMDHAERMDELTRSRDALGLAKEQRKFEDDKKELDESTSKQVAESRQQTRIRLQEQRAAFQEEQMQRREQYLEQVAEARAMADERRKEAQEEHKMQLMEIDAQKNERIQQLRTAHYEERLAMINNARETLIDLDSVLKQERMMKHNYYQAMLTDAQSFMNSYFQAMGAGLRSTSVPAQPVSSYPVGNLGATFRRQSGGYVDKGLYELHDREYVLSAATTRALEGMIGGRLTQQSVLGAGRGAVTWNDERRFYAGVKPEERRMITEDTMEVLAGALGA